MLPRRALMNDKIVSAQGENLSLVNVKGSKLNALSVYGKSTQDGTPSPDNPVPIVSAGSVMVESKNLWRNPKPSTMEGVTLTYEGNYIVLNGTCTASANFQLLQNTLFAGEYTLSAEVQGDCPDNFASLVQIYSSSTGFNMQIPNNNRNPVTNTLAETINDAYFRVRIDVGFQYNNVKIRVMLNAGQTALPYEPYFTPYADPDEGEINVTVQGGNLVDESQLQQGYIGWNNGSVTATDDVRYRSFVINVEPGTYTLSSDGDIFTVRELRNGVNQVTEVHIPVGSGRTLKVDEAGLFGISVRRYDGEPWDNSIKIMLNAGSTPLPYMPYKTPQTLTAQTPGGLPGIPVSSGGNYTDESGQQWVCDEKDFKRGKYVQRVWRKTFDGSEDEAWVNYGTSIESHHGFSINNILPEISSRRAGLCNQYTVSTLGHLNRQEVWIGVSDKRLYFVGNSFFDETLEDYGLANWKAHLAAHPLEVMAYLETPIETDLPAEEIAAYKSLHTYSPATTVSNDAGAWMKVGYREYRR